MSSSAFRPRAPRPIEGLAAADPLDDLVQKLGADDFDTKIDAVNALAAFPDGRVLQVHDRHSVATTDGTRPEEAVIGVLHTSGVFEVINASQVVSVSVGLHPKVKQQLASRRPRDAPLRSPCLHRRTPSAIAALMATAGNQTACHRLGSQPS